MDASSWEGAERLDLGGVKGVLQRGPLLSEDSTCITTAAAITKKGVKLTRML